MEISKYNSEESNGILENVVQLAKKIANAYMLLLFIGMGLILGLNIVLRYAFHAPISWSSVVSRYAYIHIVLLGTAVSYLEGGHAQIDMIYERVSAKTRVIFDLLHYGVMLFLCAILTVYGYEHVVSMWQVHPPIIPWLSMGVVYLVVPAFAIIMVLYIFQQLAAMKRRKSI